MKRQTTFLLALMALAASALACQVVGLSPIRGDGNVIQEDREVGDFHGVLLSGSGDVIITVEDQTALTIEAEKNIMQHLTADVKDGILVLGTEPGVAINPRADIVYYLAVTELDLIKLSGSGNIVAPSMEAETFILQISGSGDASFTALKVDEFILDISGSGKVSITEGQVETQNITISGSGTYNAKNVASETTTIKVSGSGNAKIWAEAELNVSISGSGDVAYFGTPQINQKVSGSGNFTSLGER